MADDARISTTLPRHPKTVKLRRRLEERGCWALVCLFLWVADSRPDGNLSGMSDEDIAIAADWGGAPGVLVQALMDVGFLDGEPGRFFIHDWMEHNPFAATRSQRIQAARDAANARWGRRRQATDVQPAAGTDADRMPAACESHAERMRPVENRNAHHTTPHHTTPPAPLLATPDTASCAQPSGDCTPIAISLPLNDGSDFGISEVQAEKWTALFGAIDVRQELRKMKAWLEANPKRRKTKRGLMAFCVSWLTRAQDSPHRQPSAQTVPISAASKSYSGGRIENPDGSFDL